MTQASALEKLEAKRVGSYALRLGQMKQLRQSGWRGFTLHLQNARKVCCDPPVIKGIFSVGGKDGVKPWMDLVYRERVTFRISSQKEEILDLKAAGLDLALFVHLSALIPPGGHVMVSYEEEDPVHVETLTALNLKIPPVATPLGFLLGSAGFHYVKNWYLSEGGHEGPRKLWAEKALDAEAARMYVQWTAREVRVYLAADPGLEHGPLKQGATERAKRVFDSILRDSPDGKPL